MSNALKLVKSSLFAYLNYARGDFQMEESMEVNEIRVHQTHCCVLHGCKYGDEDCPVENREIEQDFLCEDCESDGINSVEEAKAIEEEMRYCFESTGDADFGEYHSDILDDLFLDKKIKVDTSNEHGKSFFNCVVDEVKVYDGRIMVRAARAWFGEHKIEII